ncbi:MAG: hypothetical protein QM493_01790 [Sulfurovum sp.]
MNKKDNTVRSIDWISKKTFQRIDFIGTKERHNLQIEKTVNINNDEYICYFAEDGNNLLFNEKRYNNILAIFDDMVKQVIEWNTTSGNQLVQIDYQYGGFGSDAFMITKNSMVEIVHNNQLHNIEFTSNW